jgi:lipopolysaccharide export LptBFGC system permease protein LptF
VNEIHAELSREATEALNASMPDAVITASRARIAMYMLFTAWLLLPTLGLLVAIFGPALVNSFPGFVTVVGLIVLVLIAVMVTALVIALRAKRAFNQIAQIIQRERHATLVRVVNRQIFVRR